jgi:type II secretory pathway pseudopilin PulG
MRTSVPGHPERRLRPEFGHDCGHDCGGVRGRGATLVELLLVLLVAALFAGLALPVWRGAGDDDARGEAVRLAQLLRLAHDEARLSGVGLRWRSDGGGYGFARTDGTGHWKAIGPAEPLRTRCAYAGPVLAHGLVFEGTAAALAFDRQLKLAVAPPAAAGGRRQSTGGGKKAGARPASGGGGGGGAAPST